MLLMFVVCVLCFVFVLSFFLWYFVLLLSCCLKICVCFDVLRCITACYCDKRDPLIVQMASKSFLQHILSNVTKYKNKSFFSLTPPQLPHRRVIIQTNDVFFITIDHIDYNIHVISCKTRALGCLSR